jgi:hypothetical protein
LPFDEDNALVERLAQFAVHPIKIPVRRGNGIGVDEEREIAVQFQRRWILGIPQIVAHHWNQDRRAAKIVAEHCAQIIDVIRIGNVLGRLVAEPLFAQRQEDDVTPHQRSDTHRRPNLSNGRWAEVISVEWSIFCH